ncbi:glycosyltransferase [Bacillus mobilis]|uniref:glycosyltransferase n=1 Tax=Bacillus mobilis TaxID=2026190 RepID=UPI0013D057FB|nr:glycosyltransferase [Bacillus mobilis]NEK99463.1 glycosyltransferase [Bacillus mobilis]
MKILQINVVYKRGSTGKIVDDIHTVLKEQEHESVICYGRGQREEGENLYKTSSELGAKAQALYSRISGIQYSGSFFSTNKIIRIVKEKNPDIVHLHCINGYFVNIYRLLNYLKKKQIKTVLTLHAEFMYTGSCGIAFDCEKWKLGCTNCPQLWNATKSIFFDRTNRAWNNMREAFNGFDNLTIVSVSNWLNQRVKQSPFLKEKNLCVIENGIDTRKVFRPIASESIKRKLNLTDEKIILHVTANFSDDINDNKGGHYIIKLANRLRGENIKILVIGGKDDQMKLPDNIINIGHINNQEELASYYSLADLSIITSRRETFSMPCAESLACGTPVVGFRAGGPETIALNEYSEFVKYDDVDALEDVIKKWINQKDSLKDELVRIANIHYSKERMCSSYIDVYEKMLASGGT